MMATETWLPSLFKTIGRSGQRGLWAVVVGINAAKLRPRRRGRQGLLPRRGRILRLLAKRSSSGSSFRSSDDRLRFRVTDLALGVRYIWLATSVEPA